MTNTNKQRRRRRRQQQLLLLLLLWANRMMVITLMMIIMTSTTTMTMTMTTMMKSSSSNNFVQGSAVQNYNYNYDRNRNRRDNSSSNNRTTTTTTTTNLNSSWFHNNLFGGDNSNNNNKHTTSAATTTAVLSSRYNTNQHQHQQQQQQQQQQIKEQHPQEASMSIFGLFLASSWSLRNIKGSIFGGVVPPSPKLRMIFATITAGTATIYKINKIIRSESVRRATYFWWNIGPIVIHYKFTKFWFTKINTNADIKKRNYVYNKLHTKYSPICYNTALQLKGLYIKLMQICSSRPDFIPLQYIKLFVHSQDSLPQYPIDDIKQIINNSLKQLNDPEQPEQEQLSYDKVFVNIDEIALGSASIGQCHKATIKRKYITADGTDNDSVVDSIDDDDDDDDDDDNATVDIAVKVMHPDAEQRFQYDFQVFRWLCKVALTGWTPILDEVYLQIMSEFNYTNEASSLDIVRTNTCFTGKTGTGSKGNKSPFKKKVYIPKPYKSLCTKEVLIMELLYGIKLTDYIENELSNILGQTKSKKLLERKQLELILGQDKLQYLDNEKQHNSTNPTSPTPSSPPTTVIDTILNDCGWKTKLKLLKLYRKTQKTIDLLVDVQGYQMLRNNVFQGDPHPGNILKLKKKKKFFGRGGPSLGLIDYGQTKTITNKERYGIAKVILALEDDEEEDEDKSSDSSNDSKVEKIATAMRQLGFITKNNDSLILSKYARLFFDSDEERMIYDNCPTPQSYFKLLTELDPLIVVPDVAVFVARCGFILRGMGTLLGKQIKTSKRWSVYARQAIKEEEKEDGTSNL